MDRLTGLLPRHQSLRRLQAVKTVLRDAALGRETGDDLRQGLLGPGEREGGGALDGLGNQGAGQRRIEAGFRRPAGGIRDQGEDPAIVGAEDAGLGEALLVGHGKNHSQGLEERPRRQIIGVHHRRAFADGAAGDRHSADQSGRRDRRR